MPSGELQALADAAKELRASARVHKRSEFAHRRQAKRLMAACEVIRRECEARGITVVFDDEAKEDIHGRGDPGSIGARP